MIHQLNNIAKNLILCRKKKQSRLRARSVSNLISFILPDNIFVQNIFYDQKQYKTINLKKKSNAQFQIKIFNLLFYL